MRPINGSNFISPRVKCAKLPVRKFWSLFYFRKIDNTKPRLIESSQSIKENYEEIFCFLFYLLRFHKFYPC